jgi:hypothetical protein
MKGHVQKVWSVFTLNNLLTLVFTIYIANVVKSLYGMSQVPVATDMTDSNARVSSHITTNQHFNMEMYISNNPRLEPKRALYVGGFKDAIYSHGMYILTQWTNIPQTLMKNQL